MLAERRSADGLTSRPEVVPSGCEMTHHETALAHQELPITNEQIIDRTRRSRRTLLRHHANVAEIRQQRLDRPRAQQPRVTSRAMPRQEQLNRVAVEIRRP